MTVLAVVTGDREGRVALIEGLAEAKQFGTGLVALNLATTDLDLTGLDTDGVDITIVDHRPAAKVEPEDIVLDEIATRQATRLVIGVKRRTPVGKAILGSLSQTLLLNAPIPVLAVKIPEDEIPSSFFDNLPGGMHNVTS